MASMAQNMSLHFACGPPSHRSVAPWRRHSKKSDAPVLDSERALPDAEFNRIRVQPERQGVQVAQPTDGCVRPGAAVRLRREQAVACAQLEQLAVEKEREYSRHWWPSGSLRPCVQQRPEVVAPHDAVRTQRSGSRVSVRAKDGFTADRTHAVGQSATLTTVGFLALRGDIRHGPNCDG